MRKFTKLVEIKKWNYLKKRKYLFFAIRQEVTLSKQDNFHISPLPLLAHILKFSLSFYARNTCRIFPHLQVFMDTFLIEGLNLDIHVVLPLRVWALQYSKVLKLEPKQTVQNCNNTVYLIDKGARCKLLKKYHIIQMNSQE